jgi:hypothetical protein
MVTAMFGTMQIQAFVGGNQDRLALLIGVLLMVGSGLAVVGIGFLAYQVLKTVDKKVAAWYPIMRVVECMVSIACGIYLLANLQVVPSYMLWIYVPTVIGGLVFTYLLYVSRIVARYVAVLGLAGYGALGLGTLLNFIGVVDLNAGLAGMLLLLPGLLFELVVLPIYLFVKGFELPQTTISLSTDSRLTNKG